MGNNANGQDILIIVAVLAVLAIATPFIYAANRSIVNRPIFMLDRAAFSVAGLWSDRHARAAARLGQVDPGRYDWDRTVNITAAAGRAVAVPAGLLLGALTGLLWLLRPIYRYRRRFDFQGIVEEHARTSPYILPAIRRPRSLLDEPRHRGPWRLAESPLIFAFKRRLIRIDGKPAPRALLFTARGEPRLDSPLLDPKQAGRYRMRIDRARAARIMHEQLGRPFGGIASLAPERRALAAAFMQFAAGERAAAFGLLGRLAESFREPAKPGDPFVLDTDGVDALIERYAGDSEMHRALARHSAFETTWMVALLAYARQAKGILPPNLFRWLRPVDRTLWYALHQVRGKGQRTDMLTLPAWAEAMGVHAHYIAELVHGAALPVPETGPAVEGLIEALASEGWPLRAKGADRGRRRDPDNAAA